MKQQIKLSRRKMVKQMGSLLLTAPFFSLLACNNENSSNDTDSTSSDETTETTTEESEDSKSIEDSDDSTTTDGTIEWASGGTELILVDYPDDSLFDNTGVCALSLTEDNGRPMLFWRQPNRGYLGRTKRPADDALSATCGSILQPIGRLPD